jgi:hypothetical protein
LLRWRYLLVVPAVVLGLLGVSVAGAAMTPGTQSFEAKWADWLRAHHAGLLAQRFEEVYYSIEAPAKGGRPQALNSVPPTSLAPDAATTLAPPARTSTPTTTPGPTTSGASTSTTVPTVATVSTLPTTAVTTVPATTLPATTVTTAPTTSTTVPTRSTTVPTTSTTVPTTSTTVPTTSTTVRPGLAPPPNVPLVVQPALPGEGKWQATGPLVHGVPAEYVAQFRADRIYTSQITTAVWIDPALLRLELVPGSTEPGGS